jgi:hypothetical protein
MGSLDSTQLEVQKSEDVSWGSTGTTQLRAQGLLLPLQETCLSAQAAVRGGRVDPRHPEAAGVVNGGRARAAVFISSTRQPRLPDGAHAQPLPPRSTAYTPTRLHAYTPTSPRGRLQDTSRRHEYLWQSRRPSEGGPADTVRCNMAAALRFPNAGGAPGLLGGGRTGPRRQSLTGPDGRPERGSFPLDHDGPFPVCPSRTSPRIASHRIAPADGAFQASARTSSRAICAASSPTAGPTTPSAASCRSSTSPAAWTGTYHRAPSIEPSRFCSLARRAERCWPAAHATTVVLSPEQGRQWIL